VNWRLRKIDEDLAVIMHDFWDGPAERRTCKRCGHVIQRAGAIQVAKGGKVVAANGRAGSGKIGNGKPTKRTPKGRRTVSKTGRR